MTSYKFQKIFPNSFCKDLFLLATTLRDTQKGKLC